MPDFEIINHGSIVILSPITNAAQDWCDEHLPEEAHLFVRRRWMGGAYAIEPRYINDIINGIVDDDMTVA